MTPTPLPPPVRAEPEPMLEARSNHTATLLRDGRVLVVGGGQSEDKPGTAELYDPATRTWSSTASRTQECMDHTATLLRDGRVLVAGGGCRTASDWPSSTRAELYDPATGTWSPTGDLGQARAGHAATLLRDGRVLVVGGEREGPSAELYDPATGTWSPAGHGVLGRHQATATLLPDGRVLVAGGLERPRPDEDTEDAPAPSSEELYDPATGTWSTTGSMEQARVGHSATLLPDGRVLVVGGEYRWSEHSSAELYDPATGTWSPTSEELAQQGATMVTLLPNGKVLVMGGMWSEAEAELYDPATGTWSSAGNMSLPRVWATTTLLLDGTVLVAGGWEPPGGREQYASASTELYDPATRTWSPAWSMYAVRVDPSAVLLPDGRVLFVGGDTRLGPDSAELYDPVTQRWRRTEGLAHQHRSHAAVLLPDGRVLVAGGSSYEDVYYSQERALADAELYDPMKGSWSPTGAMSHARSGPAATLLRDGKVLIVGGRNPEPRDSPASSWLSSAELYDPTTGTWTPTAPMAHEHVQPTATLLRDGRVLVVGEHKDTWPELYDPATGTWSAAGHLLHESWAHRATLLGDGRVLVTGYGKAQVYDPTTNGWSLATEEGEAGYTATLLRNGRVLVTGGGAMGTTTAEVYDPETRQWEEKGELHIRRTGHTATLLKDGRVLVAGGGFLEPHGPNVGVARAELYDPTTGTWSLSGQPTEDLLTTPGWK